MLPDVSAACAPESWLSSGAVKFAGLAHDMLWIESSRGAGFAMSVNARYAKATPNTPKPTVHAMPCILTVSVGSTRGGYVTNPSREPAFETA